MRITRAQAVEFTEAQLDVPWGSSKEHKDSLEGAHMYNHYGKCHLQILLDQIYGENSKGEAVELHILLQENTNAP